MINFNYTEFIVSFQNALHEYITKKDDVDPVICHVIDTVSMIYDGDDDGDDADGDGDDGDDDGDGDDDDDGDDGDGDGDDDGDGDGNLQYLTMNYYIISS
jgi:hypothetical protein